MRLCRVNKKWMAKVDGPCLPDRKHLGTMARAIELPRNFHKAKSLCTRRLKYPRHLEMRTNAYAGWGITLACIRKEKQHEQRPSFRLNVDTIRHKIVRIAAWKAGVDMPSCVTGIVIRREANREGAQTATRQPSPLPHKAIEGLTQHWSIRGIPERRIGISTQSHHGARPCRPVVGITARVPPQYFPCLFCHLPRKGVIDTDKSLVNKFLNFLVAHFLTNPL